MITSFCAQRDTAIYSVTLHAGMPQLAHSLCVTPQWIQMMVRRLPWFTTPFSAALILAASAWRPSLPVVPEHGLRPALDLVAAPGWQHPEVGGPLRDEGGVLRTWHGDLFGDSCSPGSDGYTMLSISNMKG